MKSVADGKGRTSSAFAVAELVVVFAVIVILGSIFIPYVTKLRETEHRYRCLDNLGQLYFALNAYSRSNGGAYPRTPDDPSRSGYACFTGIDDANPFARNSGVAGDDVTASLWLLVRDRLCSPRLFICPSTTAVADDATTGSQRSNFRSLASLSYSYACPFGRSSDYKLNDTQRAGFALMADLNPGAGYPAITAGALAQASGNSPNHHRAGQNVLYADGHVAFQSTPYCGVDRDNIYTALTDLSQKTARLPHNAVGVQNRNAGPNWESDSDLVPTAADNGS